MHTTANKRIQIKQFANVRCRRKTERARVKMEHMCATDNINKWSNFWNLPNHYGNRNLSVKERERARTQEETTIQFTLSLSLFRIARIHQRTKLFFHESLISSSQEKSLYFRSQYSTFLFFFFFFALFFNLDFFLLSAF